MSAMPLILTLHTLIRYDVAISYAATPEGRRILTLLLRHYYYAGFITRRLHTTRLLALRLRYAMP